MASRSQYRCFDLIDWKYRGEKFKWCCSCNTGPEVEATVCCDDCQQTWSHLTCNGLGDKSPDELEALHHKCFECAIEKGRRRDWTEEEKRLVRDMKAANFAYANIARAVCRTPRAVAQQISYEKRAATQVASDTGAESNAADDSAQSNPNENGGNEEDKKEEKKQNSERNNNEDSTGSAKASNCRVRKKRSASRAAQKQNRSKPASKKSKDENEHVESRRDRRLSNARRNSASNHSGDSRTNEGQRNKRKRDEKEDEDAWYDDNRPQSKKAKMDVINWNVDDVLAFFYQIGFGDYCEMLSKEFVEQEVNGEALLAMDTKDLRESFNIHNFLHRKKIFEEIQKLRSAQ